MRRFPFSLALLLVAGIPCALLAPACSSNTGSSAGDGGTDGGPPPNRLQGEACDPALASPCLPVPGCFSARCQEGADGVNTCTEVPDPHACPNPLDGGGIQFDAGSATDAAVPSCASDLDCRTPPGPDGSVPVVYVCAFSAFEGCTATGICVFPDPPLLLDGAVQTACGCEGQPVTYVTDQRTSAPVKSPASCAASVTPDAGTDASDANVDAGAGTDAFVPVDASGDASDGH